MNAELNKMWLCRWLGNFDNKDLNKTRLLLEARQVRQQRHQQENVFMVLQQAQAKMGASSTSGEDWGVEYALIFRLGFL